MADDATNSPDGSSTGIASAELAADLANEGEYFGGERAWIDVAPDHANPKDPGQFFEGRNPSPQRTEIRPDEISTVHLGRHAEIHWDDPQRYELGTIAAVSADSAAVHVFFAGQSRPAGIFLRDTPRRGVSNPSLFVWLES